MITEILGLLRTLFLETTFLPFCASRFSTEILDGEAVVSVSSKP